MNCFQVIINILKNAKDAITIEGIKNPLIRIEITEDSTWIKISIFNTGKSIPKVILGKIFDPYFSTKDQVAGTRLGLYISKIIIENHLNGNIMAENMSDGVCFSIILPKTIDKESH